MKKENLKKIQHAKTLPIPTGVDPELEKLLFAADEDGDMKSISDFSDGIDQSSASDSDLDNFNIDDDSDDDDESLNDESFNENSKDSRLSSILKEPKRRKLPVGTEILPESEFNVVSQAKLHLHDLTQHLRKLPETKKITSQLKVLDNLVSGKEQEESEQLEMKKQDFVSPVLPSLTKQQAHALSQAVKKKRVVQATLPLPMSQSMESRLLREEAYTDTSSDISRWTPFIKKNREASSLTFPLQHPAPANVTSSSMVNYFSPRTDLEMAIDDALSQSGLKESHTIIQQNEAKQNILKDQAKEHARLRAYLFYQQQKMKRQGKIKSREFRKQIRKEANKKDVPDIQLENDSGEALNIIEDNFRTDSNEVYLAESSKPLNQKDLAIGKVANASQYESINFNNSSLTQNYSEGEDSKRDSQYDGDYLAWDAKAISYQAETTKSDVKAKRKITSTLPLIDTTTFPAISCENVIDLSSKKSLVERAFQNDDVFEQDFKAEKEEELNMEIDEEMKDVKLSTLPGWGNWSGAGIFYDQEKRKKELADKRREKQKEKERKRKDRDLNHVILNEKMARKTASTYMLPSTPYPYSKKEEYDMTMKVPIGKSWNTQKSFQQLTKPKIITKLGTVIDPIKGKRKTALD